MRCCLGRLLLSLWWLLVAIEQVSAQTISLAMPNSPIAVSEKADNRNIDDGSYHFDASFHRGNYVEPDNFERMVVSSLFPIEATGRRAGSVLRLQGERKVVNFTTFIPDTSGVRALRISTLSSINILPERSHVRAFVNNIFIGEAELNNVKDFGAIEFPLSPMDVTSGRNDVLIELVQYHRLFCGPDAAFALWSDIDLVNSGAVLDSASLGSGEAAFLMAASTAAASSGLEVRGAEALGEHSEDWINQIIQRIRGAMSGDIIPFRNSEHWRVRGDKYSPARITFLPSEQTRVSYRTGGDGAQVLLIEFQPDRLPHFPLEFEKVLPRVPSRRAPMLLQIEKPTTFAELGFRSYEVKEHYALIEQQFMLPNDYLILSNAKAEIELEYAFKPHLPKGAAFLVHINQHNIRLLPLIDDKGRRVDRFPIQFEAQYLRPGLNKLSFEVIIPGAPEDRPCPVLDTSVLLVFDSSTVTVPYSPSFYMPDMQFAFSGLSVQSLQVSDLAREAFDTTDIINLRTALNGGENSEAASLRSDLHLVTLDDFGSVPLGPYKLSASALENALFQSKAVAETTRAGSDIDKQTLWKLLDEGQQRSLKVGTIDVVSSVLRSTLNWLIPDANASLAAWIKNQNGIALLLQLDPDKPDEIWLVCASGVDFNALVAAVSASRTNGDGPRGQVAILGNDGHWKSWYAPDRELHILETTSVVNFRHVLGGFASSMPIRYTAVLLLLTLVSAVVALRFVIVTRKKND